MPEPTTIGQALDQLAGHGIYSVELIENEYHRFGLTYVRATDFLCDGADCVKLGAVSVEEKALEVAADPKGGMLDHKAEGLSVDATDIANAVWKLLYGSEPIPGNKYIGRGKGFRATVSEILKREGTNA